jgi:hypothetical protein
MMRVLVCGSRDWTDEQAIFTVLNGYLSHDMPMTVIEGGARGADSIAERWALIHQDTQSMSSPPEKLVELCVYPAQWEKYGRTAGPRRNMHMLADGKPDVVWAFVNKPLHESRGTADMVRRTRKAGIPTYVVNAT